MTDIKKIIRESITRFINEEQENEQYLPIVVDLIKNDTFKINDYEGWFDTGKGDYSILVEYEADTNIRYEYDQGDYFTPPEGDVYNEDSARVTSAHITLTFDGEDITEFDADDDLLAILNSRCDFTGLNEEAMDHQDDYEWQEYDPNDRYGL